MAVERLHANLPEPAGANDLSQSFRVVPIRLVDLHLEGGAGVPGVETNDLKSQSAKLMHEPWRHRARLDPNAGVISRMSAHRSGDLFRLCGALTPPQSMASIVDDANGRRLLLNFQTDKVGHVEAPMVQITGQRHPDRGTIERSGPHRDYPMSTYEQTELLAFNQM